MYAVHSSPPAQPPSGTQRCKAVATTAALTLLTCLAGCAYGPSRVAPGSTREQLVQQAGAPTGQYERAGQQRLEYATGPFGKHTWMVDLDGNGTVKSITQVLNDASFAQVKAGQTVDDVRWTLGRPSETHSVWPDRMVWSYRYETPFCQWFEITVMPDGTVRDADMLPDPQCAFRSDPKM
jgi:hypothetical protein